MSNATDIGRVGGLAVALGVGWAVATTPGVALAEPSDSGSSSRTGSSSSTGSPSTRSSSTGSPSARSSSTGSSCPRSKSLVGEVVIGSGGAGVDVGLAVEDTRPGVAQVATGPSTSSDSCRIPARGLFTVRAGACWKNHSVGPASQAATGEPATGSTAPTAQANPQQDPRRRQGRQGSQGHPGKPAAIVGNPSSAPRTRATACSGAVGVATRLSITAKKKTAANQESAQLAVAPPSAATVDSLGRRAPSRWAGRGRGRPHRADDRRRPRRRRRVRCRASSLTRWGGRG